MDRRHFLGLTGGAAAAVAVGCGSTSQPPPAEPTQASLSPTSSGAGAPAATGATTTPPPTAAALVPASPSPAASSKLTEYPVKRGSGPHDVAPAPDGTVWYTGQRNGTLGRLDPTTGTFDEIALGSGSSPHGVIVASDGGAWVTDSGRDEIQRVDPKSGDIQRFPLPGKPGANLNTAAFDGRGNLWYTGQNGWYGSVDPRSAKVDLYSAPRGRGPYGITGTPGGDIYYASLAGNHIAKVNLDTGAATPIAPPTPNAGPRRVWSDSQGRIWVSEWNAGQVGLYDPATGAWKEWKLPGSRPQCYAVFVDERDIVWLTDFGANAIVRFDPVTEQFTSFPLGPDTASVRQLLGRPGEVWGSRSTGGASGSGDVLVVVRS